MRKCNGKIKNFPGGPVIKTLPSNPRDAGLLPGQGVKSLHASWQKKKKKSYIVTNSIKIFKMVHIKKC